MFGICVFGLCLVFFFRAGHAMDGFIQEPCSQEQRFTEIGGTHMDLIRKRILEQEEKAEEALKK